jgi:hypothetical protein
MVTLMSRRWVTATRLIYPVLLAVFAWVVLTMEKVLKEKLGERSQFSVTPLAYIPMGSLRGGEPFDLGNALTEERYLMIYHCWKHLAKEMPKFTRNAVAGNPFNRAIFGPVSRLGSIFLMRFLRRWGIKQGYDPDRPLGLLDIDVRDDDLKGI